MIMGRKIRYQIGDVFLIELENGLKGAGRVLKKDEATVFIELYEMKPIRDKSEFDYQTATKEKPISMRWCYDDGLKSGEWEIIDNRPKDGEIIMPYFWTQDASNRKFYLMKGTDTYRGEHTGIEISKDEVDRYDACGIGGKESVRKIYVLRLRALNML
jgi:Immunity protein 26